MIRTLTTAFINSLLLFFAAGTLVSQTPVPANGRDPKDVRRPIRKCSEYVFPNGAAQLVSGLGDKIFIAEEDGKLRAVTVASNDTLWVTDLGGRVEAIYPSAEYGLFVVTSRKDSSEGSHIRLLNLDQNSGLAKFSVASNLSGSVSIDVSMGKTLMVSQDGAIEAYDAVSGDPLWKSKARGKLSTDPAVIENTIAIATLGKKIEFISALDGSTTSSLSTDREITILEFRSNQMLIAGDVRGNVINYQDQTGRVWWKFKSGGRIGAIVETDAGILVGSYDNFVYMISKYSGDVRWKRRLDGRVVHRPLVTANEAFVTVAGEDQLFAIDLDKGRLLEQTSLGTDRFPTSAAIRNGNETWILPVVSGVYAFSTNGCK